MSPAKPPWSREPLMTPGEVADAFQVHPKTVARWARDGRLPVVYSPTGLRYYRFDDVTRLLTESGLP